MNVHDLVELPFRGFAEIRMKRIAGIVHQIVEAIAASTIQRLADIPRESVKCANAADIELKSRRFPSHHFDFADK
jgi:hypothetical protein